MSRELFLSLEESEIEDFKEGDKIIDIQGDFGEITHIFSGDKRSHPFLIEYVKGTTGCSSRRYLLEYSDMAGIEHKIKDNTPYAEMGVDELKLLQKKVANTKIARRMYKDRIVEETSGHLIISMI